MEAASPMSRIPALSADEALVAVRACSINRGELAAPISGVRART
jgi:hypothetical protein